MLTEDELKGINADKVVDARGTACPGPLLAVKRSIAEVNVEGTMEVLSSDAGTKRDVPKWAKKMGHEYLGCLEEAGYFKIFLKEIHLYILIYEEGCIVYFINLIILNREN